MTDYGYADWLTTHAKKKTIMEKLERSLVPFQLFAGLSYDALAEGQAMEAELGGNKYRLELRSKSVVNDRLVYLFKLSNIETCNKWEDLLMGYSDFKVIVYKGEVVTIYPFQEHGFENIISLFEAGRYAELYKQKTLYMKNLLARYILLKIINAHKSYMSILYSVRCDSDTIPVLAGVESKEWIMYAFSRKEANELALRCRGRCKKLTVVYFINQNFENEYRNGNFSDPGISVISVKDFYRSLQITPEERADIEKKIFFLIEMLYEKRLNWNPSRLRKRIMNAPTLTDRKAEWMEVPKLLVEDALNVLAEDYNNPYDIFHLLCAANLINTYTNRYKDKNKTAIKARLKHTKQARTEKASLSRRVHIMYRFKNMVMETILKLMQRKSRHLRVELAHVFGSRELTLLVNVKVAGVGYQFKFRGIHPHYIERLKELGVTENGKYCMTRLQPVAPALYMYSYYLKWNK